MNLKKILAVALAVAAAGTVTVTALAATGNSGSETRQTRAAWGEKHSAPFKKLLDDGVVSQATYDKMTKYLKENMTQKVERSEKKQNRQNILDELLKAGIITQTEYDAMKAAVPTLEKPNAERPAIGEKPTFTGKPQRVNFFDKFVEDGVISEKTATAIEEYLKSNMPEKPEIKERFGEHADIFSKMLESGVITQAEYDAIKAAMPERAAMIRSDKAASNN